MDNKAAGFVITLGVAAIFLFLSAQVSPIWYDDAGHYLVAREVAIHQEMCYPDGTGNCNPQSQFITMGPALTWPLGIWMGFFAPYMLSGRLFIVMLSLVLLWLLRKTGFLLWENFQEGKSIAALLLVAGNIQFLTYGAQTLGEVPMMMWTLAGLFFLLSSQDYQRFDGLRHQLAGLSFLLAVLTKEYIVLPLGAALAVWAVAGYLKRRPRQMSSALVSIGWMAGGLFLWYLVRAGGFSEMMAWLRERGSYTSEFFSFSLGESLRYLLLKPLIWLGAAALVMKWRLRRQPHDHLMMLVFAFQLFFYLCSAGYDRLGFTLIFIPAIYLAEFFVAAWRWASGLPRTRLAKAGIIVVYLVVFTQKSFVNLVDQAVNGHPGKIPETAASSLLYQLEAHHIFTYDQQLIPSLMPDVRWRLNQVVPSAKKQCPQLRLAPGELLVAGPYAYTEFQECVPWQQLELIGETEDKVYGVYQVKGEDYKKYQPD